MKVIKEQIKRLHVHLPKEVVNDKEAKAAFVYGFTKDANRTSTTTLTFDEANDAIVSLGAKPFNRPFVRLDKWQKFNYKEQSHMYILSLLKQMGWTMKSKIKHKYFADMVRFGNWLQTKAPVKKPLNEMSPQEVSITITILIKMVEGKEKKTLQR